MELALRDTYTSFQQISKNFDGLVYIEFGTSLVINYIQ